MSVLSAAPLTPEQDAQARTSVVSVNPPSLESVLCDSGSNAAFAIFVQEQSNASSPAVGGDVPGVGHSVEDAPSPELHNNGIPGMRIGCGSAGCIDVKFYLQAHVYESINASAAVAPLSPAAAAAASAASPAAALSSSPTSPANLRRTQVSLARSILDRFLLHPASPPPPSSTVAFHRHAFPPLHIPVSAERLQAIREKVEAAEAALCAPTKGPPPRPGAPPALLLPADLFAPEARAVYAYLDSQLFPLFLNTLACDHLDIEALLLGGGDELANPNGDLALKRFIKSAHNAYREEYPLFYLAYESIRREVEKGPPIGANDESPAAAASPAASSVTTAAGGAAAGVGESAPSAREKTPAALWFDSMIKSIEAVYRTFLRGRAEYAIYVEDEVRQQVSEALRLSKKEGALEYTLLHALLAIKDYTVEVMKYDVMPQYEADVKIGHVTERRASLVAPTLDSAKVMRDHRASIARAAAVAAEADAPTLVPILKAPVPPPQSSAEADAADAAVDEWALPVGGGRRASIVNAAVDVPLGARRASSINKHTVAMRGRPGSLNSSPAPGSNGDAAAGEGGAAAATASSDNAAASASSSAPVSPPSEEDELNGSGGNSGRAPAPSTNTHVRSLSELRHRRSIIAPGEGRSSLSMPVPLPPPARIPLTQPPPPLDSESDEEGEAKADHESHGAYAQQNTPAFENFSQSAEALMRNPPPAPASPVAASSSSSSSAAAPFPASTAVPAFSALRRRSVVGGSSIDGSRASSASASSSAAASSAAESSPSTVSAYDPERCVRFISSVVGSPPLSAQDQELASKPFPPEGSVVCVPNLKKVPGRSIMKAKIRSETIQEVLKRVFAEREHESAVHLPGLRSGCMILKYNAAGKAAERWFKVSEDGSELCWGKVDEKTKLPLKASLFNRKKRFPLADVTRLRYGASASARFAKYNLSAKSMPWVAFSVHFPDKVLDLVCTGPNAEKDVARWFSGVQALAPLSTAYLSGAGLIWRRAQLKIRYYAMWQNITPALFLEDLVAAARQDVPHGRMPETPVVYLLDKQIANTPEEGQTKEKGKK